MFIVLTAILVKVLVAMTASYNAHGCCVCSVCIISWCQSDEILILLIDPGAGRLSVPYIELRYGCKCQRHYLCCSFPMSNNVDVGVPTNVSYRNAAEYALEIDEMIDAGDGVEFGLVGKRAPAMTFTAWR